MPLQSQPTLLSTSSHQAGKGTEAFSHLVAGTGYLLGKAKSLLLFKQRLWDLYSCGWVTPSASWSSLRETCSVTRASRNFHFYFYNQVLWRQCNFHLHIIPPADCADSPASGEGKFPSFVPEQWSASRNYLVCQALQDREATIITAITPRNNNKSHKLISLDCYKPMLFLQVAVSIFPTEAGKEHCFTIGVR